MSARDDFPGLAEFSEWADYPAFVQTACRQAFKALDEIDTLRARLAGQQAVIDAAVYFVTHDYDRLKYRSDAAAHLLLVAVSRLTDKGDG